MSTDTTLTPEEIGRIAVAHGCDPELDDGALVMRLCRAIEQAVLQSQDRVDAERYRWLRKHWFTMTSCYDGGRVEFTTGQPRYSSATEANVDEAIDHARRIEGDGK